MPGLEKRCWTKSNSAFYLCIGSAPAYRAAFPRTSVLFTFSQSVLSARLPFGRLRHAIAIAANVQIIAPMDANRAWMSKTPQNDRLMVDAIAGYMA